MGRQFTQQQPTLQHHSEDYEGHEMLPTSSSSPTASPTAAASSAAAELSHSDDNKNVEQYSTASTHNPSDVKASLCPHNMHNQQQMERADDALKGQTICFQNNHESRETENEVAQQVGEEEEVASATRLEKCVRFRDHESIIVHSTYPSSLEINHDRSKLCALL